MYFPDEYAAFESVIGPTWLSRREMFERAEEARRVQSAAEQPATTRLLGLTVVVASALMAACVILAAIAAALILSPSLARTRRAISAAYQATPAPIAAPVLTTTDSLFTPAPTGASESPQPQPTEPIEETTETTENDATGLTDLSRENGPSVPTPMAGAIPEPPRLDPVPELPPTPMPALESPLPRPELTPPPTFTPLPSPQPVLNTLQPAPEVTATLTPSPPAPPASSAPTVTPVDSAPPPTPTPLEKGAFIFRGTVRILSIRAVGSGPNQADEYVALYNEGAQQVDLSGWTLKAIRTADNTIIDTFQFGNGAIIAAGQICLIYTNELVAPDNCGFSGGFASAEPIWPDNGGARASLFNPENVEYARFTY
ncbi:MAG: lamin tail domain-containing protein [Chloroflexi bacterium]|nr:MAG: lamin tail domain-containing protein [Chloroflexota bacterium]